MKPSSAIDRANMMPKNTLLDMSVVSLCERQGVGRPTERPMLVLIS